MKFLCSNCKAKYQIADEKVAGRTLRMLCRKCQTEIVIRGEPAARSLVPPPILESGAQPRAVSSAKAGEWHVAINDVPVGPLDLAEVQRKIASGQLSADSLVWREDMDDWQPAHSVDALRPAFHFPLALPGGTSLKGDDSSPSPKPLALMAPVSATEDISIQRGQRLKGALADRIAMILAAGRSLRARAQLILLPTRLVRAIAAIALIMSGFALVPRTDEPAPVRPPVKFHRSASSGAWVLRSIAPVEPSHVQALLREPAAKPGTYDDLTQLLRYMSVLSILEGLSDCYAPAGTDVGDCDGYTLTPAGEERLHLGGLGLKPPAAIDRFIQRAARPEEINKLAALTHER